MYSKWYFRQRDIHPSPPDSQNYVDTKKNKTKKRTIKNDQKTHKKPNKQPTHLERFKINSTTPTEVY